MVRSVSWREGKRDFWGFTTSESAEKPSSPANGGLFVLSNMFVAPLQQSLVSRVVMRSSSEHILFRNVTFLLLWERLQEQAEPLPLSG